jgi:hypothetical protein
MVETENHGRVGVREIRSSIGTAAGLVDALEDGDRKPVVSAASCWNKRVERGRAQGRRSPEELRGAVFRRS